jgi:hypothetical protein
MASPSLGLTGILASRHGLWWASLESQSPGGARSNSSKPTTVSSRHCSRHLAGVLKWFKQCETHHLRRKTSFPKGWGKTAALIPRTPWVSMNAPKLLKKTWVCLCVCVRAHCWQRWIPSPHWFSKRVVDQKKVRSHCSAGQPSGNGQQRGFPAPTSWALRSGCLSLSFCTALQWCVDGPLGLNHSIHCPMTWKQMCTKKSHEEWLRSAEQGKGGAWEFVLLLSGLQWSNTHTNIIPITMAFKQVPVALSCDPGYSGGRYQEDQGLKPAQANS